MMHREPKRVYRIVRHFLFVPAKAISRRFDYSAKFSYTVAATQIM